MPALWKAPVSSQMAVLAFDEEMNNIPIFSLGCHAVSLPLLCSSTPQIPSNSATPGSGLLVLYGEFSVTEGFPGEVLFARVFLRITAFLSQAWKELPYVSGFFYFLNFIIICFSLLSRCTHHFMCFEQPQSHLEQRIKFDTCQSDVDSLVNVQKWLLFMMQS